MNEDLLLDPLLRYLDDDLQRLDLSEAEHAALDDVAFAILFSDEEQREQKMLGSVCQGQASKRARPGPQSGWKQPRVTLQARPLVYLAKT